MSSRVRLLFVLGLCLLDLISDSHLSMTEKLKQELEIGTFIEQNLIIFYFQLLNFTSFELVCCGDHMP